MSISELFHSQSFRTKHAEAFTELHKQRGSTPIEEFCRQFDVLWKQAEAELA